MATQIKFRLRDVQKDITPANQKLTPIYMFVNFGYSELSDNKKGRKYIPLVYPTNESIKPDNWGNNRAKNIRKIDFSNLNTRLDNLEATAKRAIWELQNNGFELTPETVRQRINELTGRAIKPNIPTLNQFFEKLIQEIETGQKLSSKGTKFGYTTIKTIKGFKSQFDQFQQSQGKNYNYNDIGIDFYNEFIKYFNIKNYSLNTVGKYIGWLKYVMNEAKQKGYHENDQYNQRAFKKTTQKTYEIYLKEGEIQRLFYMELTGINDKARDLFLVGCFTALRFSDYSKLKLSNIQTLESGVKVVEAIQQKTGDRVIIPIRPELETILMKYNFMLPRITDQTLNRQIKEIGQKAGINEMVEDQVKENGFTVQKTVPKYEKICSHTARRSCITNMYLAGIKPIDIMKISGHKTEKEFMKYIRLGLEETANELSKHQFFTGKTLKIAQ